MTEISPSVHKVNLRDVFYETYLKLTVKSNRRVQMFVIILCPVGGHLIANKYSFNKEQERALMKKKNTKTRIQMKTSKNMSAIIISSAKDYFGKHFIHVKNGSLIGMVLFL